MRVNAAFSRLLRLPGVWIRAVHFEDDRVVVDVALKRRRLICPVCGYSARHRHNLQQVESSWRHLDLGTWRLEIHAQLRRLECPEHGVRVEGVPFARHRAGFTRDFEQLVAWLATRTDKTTIRRLLRIDWGTVGRIIERVTRDELDQDRLENLFEIGIDEVSWRKQHRYLTLVADHLRGQIVWGAEGRDAQTASRFFNEIGSDRAHALEVVSMDMGPGYAKATREHAPQAIIAIDPFHVVALANRALDDVRRDYWNELRRSGDLAAARRFKDARWSLLKSPPNLTDRQAVTLRKLKRAGGDVWRAYTLKEALRAIFAPDLTLQDVTALIDRFISKASRSRLKPFIKLAATIRQHREGILHAVRLGINQGRTEALNNKVRLITRRAYGFHSANAALALVMLCCGPITLTPPHESRSDQAGSHLHRC
jgi:transposase